MHRVTRSFTHALVLTAWIAAAFLPTSGARGDSGTPGVWSTVNSPNASVRSGDILNGVACASASDCWAVGFYDREMVYQTLIEHWDGKAWTIVPSPNTDPTLWNVLNDVACVSASDCWAVGYSATARFAQSHNCPPGSPFCFDYAVQAYQALIEHWDGGSWTLVTSPQIDTNISKAHVLEAVTCVGASRCWAVGYLGVPYQAAAIYDGSTFYQRVNISGQRQPLIEQWDGALWTVGSIGSLPVEQEGALSDISCSSASDCWVVGVSNLLHVITPTPGVGASVSFATQPLVGHWNGTSWSMGTEIATMVDRTTSAGLVGVSCLSPADCWAVGGYLGTRAEQTLVQHFGGTSWTIVPSPNTSALEHNYLSRITCVSVSDCWASGSHMEHWDGASWSIVGSPPVGVNLYDLTCASGTDCWAVGVRVQWPDPLITFAEHYTLPPLAAITASSSSIPAGGRVSFGGEGSSAAAAGATIASYTFVFGDGDSVSQAAPAASHTYPTAGSYTASLIVTDSQGVSSINTAQVTIDVATSSGFFYTLTPCRAVDTRQSGGALVSGVARSLAIAGACGIPSTAKAVSFNLTAIAPTGAGAMAFYPDAGVSPIQGTTGTINFAAGQTRANNQILGLDTGGGGSMQVRAAIPAGGSVHVVVDVNGYFD